MYVCSGSRSWFFFFADWSFFYCMKAVEKSLPKWVVEKMVMIMPNIIIIIVIFLRWHSVGRAGGGFFFF